MARMRTIRRLALVGLLAIFGGVGSAQSTDEVTITFVGSASGFGNSIQHAITLFNEAHEGRYRVVGDFSSSNSQQLLGKLLTEFIAQSGRYDVLAVSSPWVAAVGRHLVPLSGFMEEQGPEPDAFGTILDQAYYEGDIVGLPVRFGARILFYRQDMLDEFGLEVPNTLEEYFEVARALTQDVNGDGEPEVYGTVIQTEPPLYTVASFTQFFFTQGGRFLTEDLSQASPVLLEPFTINMLEMFKSQYSEGLAPTPFGMGFQDVVLGFQTSRIAMAQLYSARALLLDDPDVSEAAGKMGYAPLPISTAGPYPPTYYGGPWLLSINRMSDKHEGAYEFIKFVASPEIQMVLALQYDNGPTLVEIYRDPEYVAINPAALAILTAIEEVGFREIFPVEDINDLINSTSRELQAYLLDEQDADQTAQNIHDNINRILGSQ